ncbi:MAG: molybdopterin molybdotransferase [Cryptosporangiaceae bacterium]|nr:molybdopterin molybdotransferase [Cryptosporangiaceae bacterium]
MAISWDSARATVHAAAAPLAAHRVPVDEADGLVLADPLTTLTALPAFDTSSVDGWAVRGPGPWAIAGRVLAGQVPAAVEPGTAVEIATGAMVPAGTDHVLRSENCSVTGGRVTGDIPARPDWRAAGEEAALGEELLAAGSPVTPGVIGLASSCGYDELAVRRAPKAALAVFGDELLTHGVPVDARLRDALGPAFPSWLRRLGAEVAPGPVRTVEDTLDAHVKAIASAAEQSDVVVTTGGTMHGPVDHLHPALAELGGEYVVDTVAVRPGFPMLVASLPGGKWLVGLPGNPQSAVVALVTLVAPLLAGLRGAALPELASVRLAADVPGRGDFTHLALARLTRDGAEPLAHAGSAMLRGVARADGFVVVRPGATARAGDFADLAPLPLLFGERPCLAHGLRVPGMICPSWTPRHTRWPARW